MKKIYYILIALIILSPIGLYLTDAPAWGEWDNSYYKKVLGFIPKGIENSTQNAPIGDYSINGVNEIVSYYLSAIIGVSLIFLIFYFLKKALKNG